jgi:NAD(P)H-dependent flavin oxidoreductase YrpB (nitropropane dioxygenase family)
MPTALQDMLGLELPIIQAPMAGAQGSALAIAVCACDDGAPAPAPADASAEVVDPYGDNEQGDVS